MTSKFFSCLSQLQSQIQSIKSATDNPTLDARVDLPSTLDQLEQQSEELLSAYRGMEEEREQFWRLFQFAPEVYLVTDEEGTVQAANQAAEWFLSKSSADLIGTPIAGLLPPEDSQGFILKLREVPLDGHSKDLELRIWNQQGEPAHALASVTTLSEGDGSPPSLLWLVRDITQRKQAEDFLHRRQEEFDDFFENATVGLHWVGPDGKILRANQAELDMLGYSREEYLGRNIAEFHADREVIEDILGGLSRGETLRDYPAKLRAKDGSIKHVLINSNVQWRDGNFVHTRCFTQDVTARKLAEDAAHRREQEFRALVENSPDIIIRFDKDLRHLYVSPSIEKATGIPVQEWIGRSTEEAGMPGDFAKMWNAHVGRVFETGTEEKIEFQYPSPSGLHFYQARIVPEFGLEGSVESVLAISRDTTVQKQAEELLSDRIQQTQDLADLGQFTLGNRNVEEVLREATVRMARTLKLDLCVVEELLPDQQEFLVRAGFGIREEHLGRRIGQQNTVGGYALQTRSPVVMENLSADQRFTASPLVSEYGMTSGVAVPILRDSQPWGYFLALTRQQRLFTEEAVHFLQAVANVLASGIERARDEAVIRELSTPILQLTSGVLLVPVVGRFDEQRAAQLEARLLQAIRDHRSRSVVLDLTGAAHLENGTTTRLVGTVRAAKLLGSEVVMTGISTDLAGILVGIWGSATEFRTSGDLQNGIEEAEQLAIAGR